MITGSQMKAARALLGIDQRQLADLADLSLPTVQRMESSEGVVRCNVESMMRIMEALRQAGVELIADDADSQGSGRGVRLLVAEAGHS
ncbi:MAG: helix-turn-helix domain-containing protein [gamma proteobacterium symbiont of Bathyaustriella thionipta]|nr:helix-turn-helix domain-containing protein [gamma proteobacterium symbiont of Bathyaustriella thionipta]